MKSIRSFLVIIFFLSGCKRENVPKVETLNIGSVTQTTATCRGNIISPGDCEMTSRGFYYGTSCDITLMDSIRVNGSSTGDYICNLTSLNPGAEYFVRAFAANCYGTGYGDTISFTTEPATVPVVVTFQYIPVSQTSASLYGEIYSNGASKIINCGFCWSTSENPTLSDNCVSSNLHSGEFSATLAGIEPNIKYYARAYATNLVGTAYGNSEYFVACSDVTNISLIGTWQSISSPCSGYIPQSILETTKLEITFDSVFTQYISNQLIISSAFSCKPYNQNFYSIVFINPLVRFPYYLISFLDCNTIELVNPFINYNIDPCDYYKRIK